MANKEEFLLMKEKIEFQKDIELMFAKNQLMPRMRQIYEEDREIDFTGLFEEMGIEVNFGYALLVQMSLRKRIDPSSLIGILRRYYEDINDVCIALQMCVDEGLVEFNGDMFIVVFDISKEDQDELNLFQYPLPMIIPPKKVNNNDEYGYLTFKGSVILKDNHHNGDVNLDHINRMNSIKLRINHDLIGIISNQWKDLDKIKDDETHADFMKRRRAFEKYDRDAHNITSMLVEDFYLTHRSCKRGRTHCQGYHVNYQGNDWNKAVIELSDGELVPLD